MKQIPLNPVAKQSLSCVLNNQVVQLKVSALRYGVFMDVYLDGTLLIGGVVCENLNRIVRSAYLGFVGDFVWFDTQGSADPQFSGFGSRWQLYYLTPDEVAQALFNPLAA